jgi:hypothetical protein
MRGETCCDGGVVGSMVGYPLGVLNVYGLGSWGYCVEDRALEPFDQRSSYGEIACPHKEDTEIGVL